MSLISIILYSSRFLCSLNAEAIKADIYNPLISKQDKSSNEKNSSVFVADEKLQENKINNHAKKNKTLDFNKTNDTKIPEEILNKFQHINFDNNTVETKKNDNTYNYLIVFLFNIIKNYEFSDEEKIKYKEEKK
ncbi:hypothetical protein GVAV_001710 [Gurleya vavrai]